MQKVSLMLPPPIEMILDNLVDKICSIRSFMETFTRIIW